jgi:energy-coupling factor transport system ATP-binding protein
MAIRLENVNYIYSPDSAFKKQALKDVNLTIHDGEFIGLIGHTGSGKSTLIQHLNGLVRATSGNIYFNDTDIYDEKFVMKNLRAKVGLVFQYPEHQLFEVTVMKDVCFGPHNLGLSDEECEARAKEALNLVGLKEKYWTKSPFELSGGQKRRVAIAGVIAMHPEVLILDEPTAGLDPKGRNDILGQIAALHAQKKMTVILVSHSMEDVAQYVDRIIVMSRGQVRFDDTPKNVFKHYEELEKIGLAAPQVTYLCHELRQKGFDISENVTTVDEARTAILNVFGRTEQ